MAISIEMNLIWKHMRQLWSRYSPTRKAFLEARKIRVQQICKDGTISKRYVNMWECENCKQMVTERDVDHVNPIGAAPREEKDLPAAVAKLYCEVGNFALLCKNCHKVKSAIEKSEGKYLCGTNSTAQKKCQGKSKRKPSSSSKKKSKRMT